MVDVLQAVFNVSRHLWQVKDRQGQGSRNNREAILELHYKDQIAKETNLRPMVGKTRSQYRSEPSWSMALSWHTLTSKSLPPKESGNEIIKVMTKRKKEL